ncbi:MAG: hypothetical protein PWP54_1193 [Thermosipho sp. (in: thermotogales)]|nr:hypothetical protein [Thermosipho sp. (in: thermotogales)]
MDFKDLLDFSKDKKILHTTHTKSDCDGISSIYWGINVFGGDYYIPEFELRTASGLIKILNLKTGGNVGFKRYDLIFIYDTERSENVDFLPQNIPYVIFDHHPARDTEFLNNAIYKFNRKASANVINLYDISIENNLALSDDVLFSFAVALYTDTAMFRTARGAEFEYLSKFLKNRKFEEILETIYFEKIDKESFIDQISKTQFFEINSLSVAVCRLNSQDEYYAYIDSLFDVLSLDVFIGILPEGIKVHVKKRHVQKVYHRILVQLQKGMNIKRDHGVWLNFFDYNLILEALKKYES